MKIICPKCRQPIDAADVNVAANVALCRRCNEGFCPSQLVAEGQTDDGPLGEPPHGCWFHERFDEWELGATTRSYLAWFLVPFMCVWSAFSLGGIYGMQIWEGKFNPLLAVFGIPFVLGTILFGSIAVMSVRGQTTLRVVNDRAEAFLGVGSIGWRRRFLWSEIERVEEKVRMSRRNSSSSAYELQLQGGGKLIKFGLGVSDERRAFLLRSLRRMLVRSRSA